MQDSIQPAGAGGKTPRRRRAIALVCLLALGAAAGGTWWYLAATADARRAADLVTELRGQGPGTITRWLAALGWQDKQAGRIVTRELTELGPAAVPSLLESLADPDWTVRATVVNLLTVIGDRRAVKPLVVVMKTDTIVNPSGRLWKAADTDEGHIRAMAAVAMGVIGDSSVTGDLITALGDKSTHVRAAAAWALGRIGDRRAVRPLLKIIGDANEATVVQSNLMNEHRGSTFYSRYLPKVHDFAVVAMDYLGPAAVADVIEASTDEDHTIRLNAAWYLCHLGLVYKRVGGQRTETRPAERPPTPNPNAGHDTKVTYLAKLNVAAFRIARGAAVEPMIDRLTDEDADVRAAATLALGHFGNPRAVSALLQIFDDKANISHVFGQSSSGELGGLFLNRVYWTDKPAETVGHRAMIAAGRIAGGRAVEALLAAATDNDPHVRLIAVAGMSYTRDPRGLAAIRKALADPNASVRATAVAAFDRRPDTDTRAAIEIAAKAIHDDHARVRARAMVILARQTTVPESLEATLAAVGSGNPLVRETAVKTLGSFKLPGAQKAVYKAMDDTHHRVRLTAFGVLTENKHPNAAEMAKKAMNDPHPEMRLAALHWITFGDYPNPAEALTKALADPNQAVRHKGVFILDNGVMWELDDPGYAAVAAEALHSDDPNVRDAAMRIFRHRPSTIVSNETFQTVLAAAVAKSPAVRVGALGALASFDHPKALETINAAKNDPNETVRKGAADALHFRQNPDPRNTPHILFPKSMHRVSPE